MINMTESPLKNILLTYRSLFTALPRVLPLPPFETSVHISFTSSSTLHDPIKREIFTPTRKRRRKKKQKRAKRSSEQAKKQADLAKSSFFRRVGKTTRTTTTTHDEDCWSENNRDMVPNYSERRLSS